MEKIKSRFFVFLGGVILCLLLLEVSLRVVGLIYSHKSESDSGRNIVSSETILCLGDSLTFGLGAPRGFSYPAQLQKLLDAPVLSKNYTVVNRGWPGQNTSQLLLRIEGYLQEFKPRIVTLLIGARNQDNFYGFKEYLTKSNSEKRGFFVDLHDSLDTIRLYKFFRLLIRNMAMDKVSASAKQHDLPEIKPGRYPSEVRRGIDDENHSNTAGELDDCFTAEKFKEMGEYEKAIEYVLKVTEKQSVDPLCYYLAGSIYNEQKQFKKAEEWFEKGIEQDPTFFGNYDGMGLVHSGQGRMKEAIQWFKTGFEKARFDSLYGHCYVGIGKAYQTAGRIEEAVRFFEKEVRRKAPAGDNYLKTLANDFLLIFEKRGVASDVAGWIEADIERLLKIIRRYKAKIVFQNYPFEPAIDSIYRKISQKHDLVFVDHQGAFQQHTLSGELSSDFFVPDGHPNAKGYHLMAKNILKVLQAKIDDEN